MRIVQYKAGYPYRSGFWRRYSFAIIKEIHSSCTMVDEINGINNITTVLPHQQTNGASLFEGIATIIYNDEE